MYSYSQVFTDKKTALFVTAHPDDVLVFFGGLIHQLIKDKKNVYVVVTTNGARGSRENDISEVELAKQRLAEERAALQSLGLPEDNVFCLGYLDGEVESNMKLIGEIAKYLRKYKVDIVCTHEPSQIYLQNYDKSGFFVQHRDHRKVGEAVIDAVYPFSRDKSFFPEHYVDGIVQHSVYDILLTDEKDCNFNFDLTANLELKKQAMRSYKSQFSEETIESIIQAFTFEGKQLEKFNYVKLLW